MRDADVPTNFIIKVPVVITLIVSNALDIVSQLRSHSNVDARKYELIKEKKEILKVDAKMMEEIRQECKFNGKLGKFILDEIES